MTIFEFTGRILAVIWNFFRLPFPATNVPIGALLFLPMVINVAIAFLRNLFGSGGFGTLSGAQGSYRNASARDHVKTYNIKRSPSKGQRGIK